MELSQLRYFLAAAEAGSFSAAARDQYVAQQSLSKAIANLEAELGAPLFDRTSKGVVLTPYGEIVRASSVAILAEIEGMNEQIRCLRASNQQRLSVSISQSLQVDAAGFKEVIERCAARGLAVAWQDDPNGACLNDVASGKADAACILAAEAPCCEGTTVVRLASAQLYLTLDKNLPFAYNPTLTAAELSQLKIPYYDDSMRELIELALAQEEPRAKASFEYIDPRSSQFELFLLTRCNATVVVANFVLAARSGAHTVRSFPSNGWKPGVFLVMREEARERASILVGALMAMSPIDRATMLSGPVLDGENEGDFIAATV